MGGGRSTGNSPLRLATVVTIAAGQIVTVLVVGWVGPIASKAETLERCQSVRTGNSKVLGEMDLTWGQKEETLLRLSETGSVKGSVKEEGSLICQTKTRVETLAPVEPVGGIPETKMGADGVSLGARRETLWGAVTLTTTPSHRETPQVQPAGYLSPPC